jgi:hypothetical protein
VFENVFEDGAVDGLTPGTFGIAATDDSVKEGYRNGGRTLVRLDAGDLCTALTAYTSKGPW